MLKKEKTKVLTGTTLRVYITLLKTKRPMGPREIQRLLGMKSPSTAAYHLNKLVDMGFVEKVKGGNFKAIENPDALPLTLYSIVAGQMIPRTLPYALMFTSMLLAYLILKYPDYDLYATTFGLIGVIAFWIETIRSWLLLRRFLE